MNLLKHETILFHGHCLPRSTAAVGLKSKPNLALFLHERMFVHPRNFTTEAEVCKHSILSCAQPMV